MYAKIENNKVIEYPLGEIDIRRRFKNVSFQSPFSPPSGYVKVNMAPPLNLKQGEMAIPTTPKLIENVWQEDWKILQITEENKEQYYQKGE